MKSYIPKSQENLQTIETLLKTFAIQPLLNDGENYFSIKEINPESQMSSIFDKEVTISLSNSDHDVTQIKNSFVTLEFNIYILFDNKFDKFDEAYKDGAYIFVSLKNSAELIKQFVLNHRGKTIDEFLQNNAKAESFIYNTILPKSEKNNKRFVHSYYENVRNVNISCSGRYPNIKKTSDVLVPQNSSPYVMPVGFTVSIPLDDLFIFSAFSEYLNSLFSDLKIKFKINPCTFVFCLIDPIISIAKYYIINKDELLSSGQDKLQDFDLFFAN
ncbi:MAG: hypothetical protein EZS28_001395 [Streblomastix strix]|uniref:Uncharacterized protein n=1 Tax=Streblomastix strix TaxID=222440 RepID=A0A5J4X7D9_9EUKA|nr:MAG: hypothetical protein EZS28_001395 [Streblomastix strix]